MWHETNLSKCRVAKGYTQEKLAQVSGLGFITIRKLECEERKIENSSISTLIKLAAALDVPIYRLLDDKDMINAVYKVEKGGNYL